MTEKQPNRRRLQKMWEMGEQLEELRANIRERKTERLQLRVTPTEKEEVEWITDMLGVSAADYLMHFHRKALEEFEEKLDRDARRSDDDGSSRRPSRPRRDDGARSARSARRKARRRKNSGDDEGALA